MNKSWRINLIEKVVILIAFITYFQAGNCLKCFTCTKEECEKGNSSTWIQIDHCGSRQNRPNYTGVCVVIKIKDQASGSVAIERKCANGLLSATGDISFQCPTNYVNATTDCDFCVTDWCNEKITESTDPHNSVAIYVPIIVILILIIAVCGTLYYLKPKWLREFLSKYQKNEDNCDTNPPDQSDQRILPPPATNVGST